MAKRLRSIDQVRFSKENGLGQQTAERSSRRSSREISANTDEIDNQSYKSAENAPPVPRELMPPVTIDYFDIIKKLGVLVAVAGPVGTAIWWAAKLDSKVESSALDILEVKPKVERILVTIEGQNEKIKNLENKLTDIGKEKRKQSNLPLTYRPGKKNRLLSYPLSLS